MTDAPELSIVIVSYNTRQLLMECLESIYAHASVPLQVIVVDNCSSDGTQTAVQTAFPQVKLLANTHNAYFSGGNNQGIMAACGRYVMVMNPDMLVRGDTFRQLVEQMDADPTIGAATTVMYFPDGRLQRNGSYFSTYPYLLFNYTLIGKLLPARKRAFNDWLWIREWDRTTARDIDVLPGSCIIAKRETWQRVGGFDPYMPMYFSDEYFSLCVQQGSGRTRYLCSDGLVHYEGQSAKQVSAWALSRYLNDLLVYTRRRWGWWAMSVLAVLLIPTWIVQRIKAR
ncbi:MAG: glycosyltransferase family 2 protein [Anaerolineae bacterium]|nr:glycosyltransferase family 2 protein [Anaerolineae bacterium]